LSSSPPLLDVRDVIRSFGDVNAVSGVSLQVQPGELLALLGPSGAGKTSLVRMIAGADKADSGRVLVNGLTMPSLEALRGIGYMAQSDALYLELTGRQNLEFFGALFSLRRDDLRAAIERSVDLVDLQEALDRAVMGYSGGMKRRLSLAIALLHQPRLLVLDEPTVGLDPVLRRAVWQELRALADGGVAVLITTHVMDEAGECDRVCMMREGRLIADDSPSGLLAATAAPNLTEAFVHYARSDS
jgi:ABC-2 type transport system ATP-binding protein